MQHPVTEVCYYDTQILEGETHTTLKRPPRAREGGGHKIS